MIQFWMALSQPSPGFYKLSSSSDGAEISSHDLMQVLLPVVPVHIGRRFFPALLPLRIQETIVSVDRMTKIHATFLLP